MARLRILVLWWAVQLFNQLHGHHSFWQQRVHQDFVGAALSAPLSLSEPLELDFFLRTLRVYLIPNMGSTQRVSSLLMPLFDRRFS